MEEFSLSERKKTLLYSAIDNYIKLASPITSLLVQQTELHDLSTATIRNELNALEAMGYLKQPHTSSGRVPTTKGYRFFVNETLKSAHYTGSDLSFIKEKMFNRTSNLSEIVDNISKAVSKHTNYPTVFMFDGFENLTISSIKVIYLMSAQVLVLIETNVGAISNTVPAGDNVTKQDCDNATNVFNSIFVGKEISYLMQNANGFSENIKSSMAHCEEVFNLVLQVLDGYYNKTKSKVDPNGLVKLLESKEASSVENVKNILSVLGDDNRLQDVMNVEGGSINVNIGEENEEERLSDCAVIKAPLVLDGKRIATVGVIGPERIDYASIASVLKFVADELKNNFKGGQNG